MTSRELYTALLGMALLASLSAAASSQAIEKEDFDTYKLRIDAGWYYSNPTGSASAQAQKPNILFMGDDIGWMQPTIYHRGLMVGETPKSTFLEEFVQLGPSYKIRVPGENL